MDLYVSDTEIAKQLKMTLEQWLATAQVLERAGFPRRDALFGDRRCWPAVEQFLVARARPSAAGGSAFTEKSYVDRKNPRLAAKT